jgi:hypothetical protein
MSFIRTFAFLTLGFSTAAMAASPVTPVRGAQREVVRKVVDAKVPGFSNRNFRLWKNGAGDMIAVNKPARRDFIDGPAFRLSTSGKGSSTTVKSVEQLFGIHTESIKAGNF